MADYIGATRTRVLACDITLTDSGGDFTLTGVVSLSPASVRYTATFGNASPSGRQVTLNIVATAGPSQVQILNTTVTNPSTLTGTLSLSVATRELVQVGNIPATVVGPIVIDPGMVWGARSRELQHGSSTATITLLGQTVTKTASFTDGNTVGPGWLIRADTDLLGSNSSGGHSISATTLPSSATCSAPSTTITRAATYSSGGFTYTYDCTATADASSASSSADADSTFSVAGIYAHATANVKPDRAASFYGLLQRMVAAWPDPIEWRLYDGSPWVSSSTGAISGSVSQKSYDVTTTVFDHTGGISSTATARNTANERANLLPSVRDQGGLRIYGPRWDAISLAWTDTQTIDDGTSLSPTGTWAGNWTAAGGGSVSVVSGAIHLTGSAGKSVTRSFSTTSWQAYSRLRIRLTCSAAPHDITLRLGADQTVGGITYRAKEWTLTTGAGGGGTSSVAALTYSGTSVTGTTTGANSYGQLFTLSSSIVVDHLGIFDSGNDGISGSRTVYIYSGSTGSTVVASVGFSADGTLDGVFRYKSITPVTLTAGTYRVAVDSGSTADPFWNQTNGGSFTFATASGAISWGDDVFGTAGSGPGTTSGPTVTIVSASFKYQVATPSTTDLYVDLGGETSGPDYSVWDFGNQIATPGAYKTAYFGGGGSLTLEDLGAGTYDIEEIELLTAPDGVGGHNEPLVHCFRDYLISQVDGILGFRYQSQISGGGTIADLVTLINSQGPQGYSASDLAAGTATTEPWPLSELQTSRHTNVAIGGYGLLFAMSGTSPAWSMGFDSGAFGIGNLPAQWTVSELAWDWPESDVGGFLWDDGAGGKAIGAGLSAGASVWGRVLGTTDTQTAGDDTAPAGRDPSGGTGVTLKSLAGVTLATATTDSVGRFSFGALASLDGTVRVQVDGQTGYLEGALSAQRSRMVIVNTPPGVPGTLLAMAVSVTGRVVRAYRDTSDDIVLEFWRRTGWDATTTSLNTTGNGAMCYDHQDSSGRLWLVLEESGGIKSRYTDDEGGTWSVAVTIASSGTDPAIWPSPTGLRHYFWRDSAAIKTKVLDSQDTAVVSTTTVVASGVADSPIDALYDGSLWHLTYRNTSNAVVTVVSSDGGLTFS